MLERLESKYFIAEDTCWIWFGATSNGYGRIGIGSVTTSAAHREMYKILIGEIPEGLYLDHLCRNRSCVNPYHLEPVTHAENIRRGLKTHKVCEHGSGYTRCVLGCAVEYNRAKDAKSRSKRKERERNGNLANSSG
jgi:hypothetical protein